MSLTVATYQLGPGFYIDKTLNQDRELSVLEVESQSRLAEIKAVYNQKLIATAERLSKLADVLLIQTSTSTCVDQTDFSPFFETLKDRGFEVFHGSEKMCLTYIAIKEQNITLVGHETIYFSGTTECYSRPLDATAVTLKLPNSEKLITIVSLCFDSMVLFNQNYFPSIYSGDVKSRIDNLNYLTEVIIRIGLQHQNSQLLLGGGFCTDRFNDDRNCFKYLDDLKFKELQAPVNTYVWDLENLNLKNRHFKTDGFWIKAPTNEALPNVSVQVPDNFINENPKELLSRESLLNTTSVSSHKPVIATFSFGNP